MIIYIIQSLRIIGKFNNLDEFYIIAHKVNYIYKKLKF
jgi:hypothetical protein